MGGSRWSRRPNSSQNCTKLSGSTKARQSAWAAREEAANRIQAKIVPAWAAQEKAASRPGRLEKMPQAEFRPELYRPGRLTKKPPAGLGGSRRCRQPNSSQIQKNAASRPGRLEKMSPAEFKPKLADLGGSKAPPAWRLERKPPAEFRPKLYRPGRLGQNCTDLGGSRESPQLA